MYETSPFRHPFVWLRNKLLAGLALVVPIIVTFWILRFVYEFLQGMSAPLLRSFGLVYNQAVPPGFQVNLDGENFQYVVGFVGFLIPLLFLIALGVMATNVIGVRVVGAMDKLLLRVPVISFIYKSLKQVIEAFRGFGDTRSFKRVVYVEYPSPGMKLIGFVTGQFFDEKLQQSMTLVFLPGALSPMTGLLIVAESSKVVDAPLSLEEAMKIVFSGGLIGPDTPADKERKERESRPSKKSWRRKPPESPLEEDFEHLPKADDLLPDLPEAAEEDKGLPKAPALEREEHSGKGQESSRELAGTASAPSKSSILPWLKR